MSEIIRITIDSVSGKYAGYEYSDRLEISRAGVSYIKAIENKDNYEWNYSTTSILYKKKLDILFELFEIYLGYESDDIPEVSSFTVYALYSDGNIKEKTFPLTFDFNGMLGAQTIIKDFIPVNEEYPDYFQTDIINLNDIDEGNDQNKKKENHRQCDSSPFLYRTATCTWQDAMLNAYGWHAARGILPSDGPSRCRVRQ